MVKVYKMEVTVIDFEGSDVDDIVYEIENSRYWSVKVVSKTDPIETEWDDDHPLNKGTSYDDWSKSL